MAKWNLADLERLFDLFNKRDHYVYFGGEEIQNMEIKSMQDDPDFEPWFETYAEHGNGLCCFNETSPEDFEVFVIHKVDWKKS
jgi:hypothetical protein